MRKFGRLRRAIVGASVLAIGLAAGSPLADRAEASVTYCRTDPSVTLSNGVTVTMWADIATDISNVSSVNYVLHVPSGVTVTSVTFDSNWAVEHLQVVDDQSGTRYGDDTTVYLTSGSTSVTAYATRRDATVASKTGKTSSTISLKWAS